MIFILNALLLILNIRAFCSKSQLKTDFVEKSINNFFLLLPKHHQHLSWKRFTFDNRTFFNYDDNSIFDKSFQ